MGCKPSKQNTNSSAENANSSAEDANSHSQQATPTPGMSPTKRVSFKCDTDSALLSTIYDNKPTDSGYDSSEEYFSADEEEPDESPRIGDEETVATDVGDGPTSAQIGSIASRLPKGLNVLHASGRQAHREEGTSGCYRMRTNTELFEGEQLFVFRAAQPEENGKYHSSLFEGKKTKICLSNSGPIQTATARSHFFPGVGSG